MTPNGRTWSLCGLEGSDDSDLLATQQVWGGDQDKQTLPLLSLLTSWP